MISAAEKKAAKKDQSNITRKAITEEVLVIAEYVETLLNQQVVMLYCMATGILFNCSYASVHILYA